jgi:hypothetical protein
MLNYGASRSRTLVGTFFGTLIAGCAIAYWLGWTTSTAQPPAIALANAGELDCGEVWETAAFNWSLSITNHTQHEANIVGFAKSCDCIAIDPKSLVLQPAETVTLKLTLDLTKEQMLRHKTGKLVDETVARDFLVKIAPQLEGGNKDALPKPTWTIRGRVKRVLSVTPRLVQFDHSFTRGQRFLAQQLIVTTHVPIQQLVATAVPDNAVVQVDQAQGTTNEYRLSVAPRDDLPAGLVKFKVVVSALGTDRFPFPPVSLPAEAMILDDIQASPRVVILGARPLGQIATETVVLQSSASLPFEVHSVECESKEVTVEKVESTASRIQYKISQRIVETGSQSTQLHFQVRTKGSEKAILVPVGVSYLGLRQ